MSPDVIKTAKVCPECGIEMSGRNSFAHSLTHWTEYLEPVRSSKEARIRQKLCVEGGVTPETYQKLHGE